MRAEEQTGQVPPETVSAQREHRPADLSTTELTCRACGGTLRQGRIFETPRGTHTELRCQGCGRTGCLSVSTGATAVRRFGQVFQPTGGTDA